MASDIAVGLAVLAAAKTEERLRREVEQRRIEEERRRRELAARVKHIQDRRTTGLSALLSELDELDRLRRLIAMLTESFGRTEPQIVGVSGLDHRALDAARGSLVSAGDRGSLRGGAPIW